MAILVVVPVWVSAWLLGAPGGLVSGLLAFLLNMTLASFIGIEVRDWLAGGGMLGSSATLLVGVMIGYLRDTRYRLKIELAEGRKAQAALKESEEKYRQLYDGAPVGYLAIDRQGFLTIVNQTFAEMLLNSTTDMIGKRVWSFMAPEYQPISKATILEELSL